MSFKSSLVPPLSKLGDRSYIGASCLTKVATLSRYFRHISRLRASLRIPHIQQTWNCDSTHLGRVAIQHTRCISSSGIRYKSSGDRPESVGVTPSRESAQTRARDSEGIDESASSSEETGVLPEGEEDFFTSQHRQSEVNGPRSQSTPLASDHGDASADLDPWEEEDPWEFRPRPPGGKEEEEEYDASRRIYVLGIGSVGCFIAHSVRQLVNPPPVTLLVKRLADIAQFERQGRTLSVYQGEQEDRQAGFDIEALRNMQVPLNAGLPEVEEDPPILNLIVTVKAKQTLQALINVAHRLGPDSTVCLVQNGMGQVEEVIEELFPDPKTRPTFIMGINSHGLFRPRGFHTEHRGKGYIYLSIIDRLMEPTSDQVLRQGQEEEPQKLDESEGQQQQRYEKENDSDQEDSMSEQSDLQRLYWSESSRYMMRTLTRSLTLAAVGVKPAELFVLQLEKLAANAVINPLTAIYQCRNGDLLNNRHMTATMRLMLAEISLVLQSLPELRQYFPAVNVRDSRKQLPDPYSARSNRTTVGDIHFSVANRLAPEALEFIVLRTAKKTQDNESSMMVDVKEARDTEIEYINGYIVHRGEELGIKCIVNYAVMTMLQARATMSWRHSKQLAYEEDWNQLSPEVKDMLKSSGNQ